LKAVSEGISSREVASEGVPIDVGSDRSTAPQNAGGKPPAIERISADRLRSSGAVSVLMMLTSVPRTLTTVILVEFSATHARSPGDCVVAECSLRIGRRDQDKKKTNRECLQPLAPCGKTFPCERLFH
jgi:hypothetical protein